MSVKKSFIIIVTFIIIIIVIYFLRSGYQPPISTLSSSTDKLQLLSTNPKPLDGATILPTQVLEFTFSQPVSKTEFKHHFDPEVDHQVEVVEPSGSWIGTKLRITFKKPLQLGSGYTLFVESSTHSEDQQSLGQDYIYHFSTIKYTGI